MLNTENAKIENIKVKNNDIMLIYKENNICLLYTSDILEINNIMMTYLDKI